MLSVLVAFLLPAQSFSLDEPSVPALPLSLAEEPVLKAEPRRNDETDLQRIPYSLSQSTDYYNPQSKSRPLLDFKNGEATPFAGFVMFSGEFDADPSFSLGAQLRIPSPALPWRRFGVFVQASFSTVDRDLLPFYENPDGGFMTFAGGLDFDVVQSDKWILRAQAGGLYARYDDISGLDDGFGVLLGGMVGVTWVQMRNRVSLCYIPQFAYDGEDSLFFHHVGITIGF